MIKIIIILAFCFSFAETPSIRKEVSRVLSQDMDTLVISDTLIVNGSVSIRENGLLLQNDLWRIENGDLPVIRFIATRDKPLNLSISYQIPTLPIGKRVWKRKLELLPESADSAVIKDASIDRPLVTEETSALTVGGSKTLGVTVGSGGALAVNQTLDLSVYGEIAKGIEVKARLADQNLPFRSEGSTESIREIDKILIEVKSKRASLVLGDMNFTEKESRFASYDKKIKGIRGEVRNKEFSGGVGAALSDGRFYSYSFQGEEGRQGPYIIVDGEGKSAPVVLSGTERVFINGRVKQRGEGNDYTMDYTSGRLTFTPRCLITADDRIMVEFEYMDSEYQKTVLSGGAKGALFDNRLSFAVSGFSESDDYSRPATGEMTKEEISALSKAGDSSAPDGEGARLIERDSVALYRGFYTSELSSIPLDSQFVFVYHRPKDTSLYRNVSIYDVSFLFTGSSRGSYVLDSVADSTDPGQSGTYATMKKMYRYVGEANGDYKPGRKLIAPLSHDIGHISYHYNDSLLSLRGEFSGSKRDLNSLSKLDDNDNSGYAFFNDLSLRTKKLIFNVRQEERSSTFRSVSTIDDPYIFSRKWNYSSDKISDPYLSLVEAGAVWSPIQPFSIRTDGGRLKRTNFAASRGEIEFTYMDPLQMSASLNGEGIRSNIADSSKDVFRLTFDAQKQSKVVIPRLVFLGEYTGEKASDINIKKTLSAEGKFSAKNGQHGFLTGESELSGRIDRRTLNYMWVDSALSATWINRGYLDFGKPLRADIAFTHRQSKREYEGSMRTVQSNLISVQGSSDILENAVDQRIMYSLSTEQSELMVPIYIAVPIGTGTHIRDPLTGDYIPRESGDFLYGGQVVDTNAQLQDALKSSFSYRFSFVPRRLPSRKNDTNILKYLSLHTYWNAEQDVPRSLEISNYRKYLPDFAPLRAAESELLQYRMEARQDLLLDDTERRYSLRLRFLPRYRYSMRSASDNDRWSSLLWSLSLKHPLFVKAQFEHTLELEDIDRLSGRTATDYNVTTSRAKTSCDIEAGRGITIPLILGGGISRTTILGSKSVPFIRAEGAVSLSKQEKGRGELRYIISNVFYDEVAALPYDAADGEKSGLTHKVNALMKLNATKNIDLDLSVFWERNSIEARSFVRGNMELRAYF